MSTKILINAVDHEECRIAKVKDSRLEQFNVDSAAKEITHGNIYKGIITRVEPSLQAAFIDYGAERNGFLQKYEIHSDYFQDLESGDRDIRNLVKRGQELLVQVTKEPLMKKGAMLTTYISLAGRYLVLMPGSTSGNDLAPLLAAEIKAACVIDCDEAYLASGQPVFKRLEYDRKVYTHYKPEAATTIATTA